jgi:outer membrane protein OmpA-like peptidoglycan-associated protein
MAEDWAVNVKSYDPDADDGVIAGIVKYCGIALQKKDSSLVSFGDPVETGRVRENYLKKKLGLTNSDADLDSAIAKVGERMKGESFRNRVTVYYLLAQHFGMLHLFGKGGKVSADAAPSDDTANIAAAAPVAAVAAAASLPSAEDTAPAAATSQPLAASYNDEPASGSGMGWLPWLLLALGALALIWWLFFRQPAAAPEPVAAATETAAPVTPETSAAATEPAAPATTPPPAEGTVAIPTGAGVTTEARDGKPVVKVYFATSKTDIAPAFPPAAAGLKAYLDGHPGSSLAVSGFADKRGNAAANEALSKGRAEAVQAALVAAGIPATAIELVKPADAVQGSNDLAGARRVEVVVR